MLRAGHGISPAGTPRLQKEPLQGPAAHEFAPLVDDPAAIQAAAGERRSPVALVTGVHSSHPGRPRDLGGVEDQPRVRDLRGRAAAHDGALALHLVPAGGRAPHDVVPPVPQLTAHGDVAAERQPKAGPLGHAALACAHDGRPHPLRHHPVRGLCVVPDVAEQVTLRARDVVAPLLTREIILRRHYPHDALHAEGATAHRHDAVEAQLEAAAQVFPQGLGAVS
mmetsp:Transcript_65762/g.207734  ORF Transcript_65762/g.207734 Transcript_65762/m.207734 type:complete len:223 (-) Transcript_65762:531-1199(-)